MIYDILSLVHSIQQKAVNNKSVVLTNCLQLNQRQKKYVMRERLIGSKLLKPEYVGSKSEKN